MFCDSVDGSLIGGMKDGLEQLSRTAIFGRFRAASSSLSTLGVGLLHCHLVFAARLAIDASRFKLGCIWRKWRHMDQTRWGGRASSQFPSGEAVVFGG